MDHLQLRTIGFTAKHRPLVGQIDHRALLRHHVGTAIAAGEVQAPIRSENEPMQVVAREAETHPEAVQNRPRFERLGMHLGLGLQRGFLGFRQVAPNRTGRPDVPQRRNLGKPHLPLAGQHTTANAAEGAGEVFCHDLGVVRPAIVIGVLQFADHFRFLAQRSLALGTEPFANLGQAVFHGARGQIVLQHEHVMPDIEHTGSVPVRFAGEHAPLFIHREGHGIGQLGFSGPEFDRQAWG